MSNTPFYLFCVEIDRKQIFKDEDGDPMLTNTFKYVFETDKRPFSNKPKNNSIEIQYTKIYKVQDDQVNSDIVEFETVKESLENNSFAFLEKEKENENDYLFIYGKISFTNNNKLIITREEPLETMIEAALNAFSK
jgi:hypothetical protein